MVDQATADRKQDALAFLTALYGRSAPGFLTLWRRQDRNTLWVPANDQHHASRVAISASETMDVYVGIGSAAPQGAPVSGASSTT